MGRRSLRRRSPADRNKPNNKGRDSANVRKSRPFSGYSKRLSGTPDKETPTVSRDNGLEWRIFEAFPARVARPAWMANRLAIHAHEGRRTPARHPHRGAAQSLARCGQARVIRAVPARPEHGQTPGRPQITMGAGYAVIRITAIFENLGRRCTYSYYARPNIYTKR